MPFEIYEDGSQTTSGTTEHFLGTDNDDTDGIFRLSLNLGDIVDTEELEVRIYGSSRDGDAVEELKMWKFRNAQISQWFQTPEVWIFHNRRFSIKATAGSGIVVPWAVYRVS
jgi:hypothetical protein